VGETARKLGVTKTGYRMLTNIGRDANQEVMHFHVHIFAGRPLGGMIKRV
jgi:diadenosine tetraphosphate (Ap4A) HIT family hydrolase